MRYGLLVTMFFMAMDLLYGRARSWSKFKVLEVIARVPYQTWEHVAHIAITHTYERVHKQESLAQVGAARFA